MKWVATPEALKPLRFEIKRDEKVGFYLYVFSEAKCTHDYLQDTLEDAMKMARGEFGVNQQDWSKTD